MVKLIQRIFLAASGGLPVLFLAFLIIKIWVDPLSVDDGGWVKLAASLIMLEFLLLHSGAFMAAGPFVVNRMWQKLGWFLGFGVFYAWAIIAYASWTGGRYVKLLLLSVVISRLLTLVVLHDKRGTILIMKRSVFGMLLLITTCLIIFIPWPHLGLTEEIRSAIFGSGDDMLAKYPERTIAWGIAYFFLMGIFELYLGWYLPDWSDEEVEKTWGALSK